MKQIKLEMNYGDVDCYIAGRFLLNNSKYICLIPFDTNNKWLFKLENETKDSFDILPLEDQDEFNLAADKFMRLFGRY